MLSIVIPTLNAGETIRLVLEQVSNGGDEVVVSDGGSTDKTLKIALEYEARMAMGCEGRGWQLARGARWARGDWLMFIHADTQLPNNWKNLVSDHIQSAPKRAAYFRFGIKAKGIRPRLMEILANARTFWFGLPYGDQGMLISRSLYDQVGGFPDWPLFEDVAIVRALGRRNLRRLNGQVATCPKRFERNGYAGNLFRNMTYITRFILGGDPEKIARAYRK